VELSGKSDVNTRFCWGNSKVSEHLEDRGVDGPGLIRHYEDVRQTKCVCVCVVCVCIRIGIGGMRLVIFCAYVHDE
jgi:hypothetical protein